ncbi:MAG: DUF2267 domain-containing protein [Caulobacter sp.]|nr:DUF2267 domain-containing protein [Caulobacter sp.]
MSTGLAVFDTTVQETNEWLRLVEAKLPPCSRQQAYGALRAVLHILRDRLPMHAVLGLSAQLPMLLRGVFLEGWRPGDGPSDIRDPQDFAQAVADLLPPSFPREPNGAAEAVFAVMAARLDPGEVAKLIQHLPTALRTLWPIHHRAA